MSVLLSAGLLLGPGLGESVGLSAGLDDDAVDVRRSTMAAQRWGSVNVLVQPPNAPMRPADGANSGRESGAAPGH